MPFSAEYWYLFPAAIAIATVAMASGIGGAVGGQSGPMVQAKVAPDRGKLGIAGLFMGVGGFVLVMGL